MIQLFPDLSRTEQRVLYVVFKSIQEDDEYTATITQLAHDTGISRQTVRNAVKRAIKAGLLHPSRFNNQFPAH